MKKETLEQRERAKGVSAPFMNAATAVAETAPFAFPADESGVLSLCGKYKMTEGGDTVPDFENAVDANIPCTVQTALFNAGKIPDPMVDKNDRFAREAAYKTWWFKYEFDYSANFKTPVLHFDGVCYHALFYLNGVFLGEHKGMFGGPDFYVGDILREHNTLTVKIENAPADRKHYSDFADFDEGWKNAVVVNCVYGWHYACIPTRGIWAPVFIFDEPKCRFERPFVVTEDYKTGKIGVCMKCEGAGKGTVGIKLSPENFEGKEQYFSASFDCKEGEILHYTFNAVNRRLWWPNGYGDQPLYRIRICVSAEGQPNKTYDEVIGIRQVEMLPIEGVDEQENYNWLFSVNGKTVFIKGTNWCTTDALMRFSNERYDRFLTLAKEQNLQLLRAWGGGMPESDYFYGKCDELGLLVQQEWPTCWDSPKTQPYDELVETVKINTVRLRNHPSLVRWAGGNELSAVDEPSMKKMQELAVSLDGSRPFHRTSPYAGSLHNYDTYWMMEDMDNAINLRAPFIGEFGMASCPNIESVAKYVPAKELEAPVSRDEKSAFNYHTPRFNEFLWPEQYNDMDHLLMRSKEFFDIKTVEDFILGTQLAQGVAICHTLEAQRADFPKAAGICYYKLTDVYPACSWSTVDYYGVPKIPYYMIKEAFKPLHAMLVVKSINAAGEYPVILLDDNLSAAGKQCVISVCAYDGELKCVCSEQFGFKPESTVNRVGVFKLDSVQKEAVRLIEVRLFKEGVFADSLVYFQNYKKDTGCYKRLPQTRVEVTSGRGKARVKNTGEVAAVGVFIECVKRAADFYASDNFLILQPGEEREVDVNFSDGLTVRGLNI